MCALQLYDAPALGQIVHTFNSYNFERLDHDLRYEEYKKITDVVNALKYECDNHKIHNSKITAAVTG